MLKPILFNTEMVWAILEGRKTETRRVIKSTKYGRLIKPYEEGDVLWVREAWDFIPCITCGLPCASNPGEIGTTQFGKQPDQMETADGLTDGCFLYRADGETPVFSTGHNWRPSIHMPKQAARIFLRVTEIFQERLQEIDGAGLLEEGISRSLLFDGPVRRAFDEFQRLWDSTIRKDRLAAEGWAADPWVWVIRFERCERPEGWPE